MARIPATGSAKPVSATDHDGVRYADHGESARTNDVSPRPRIRFHAAGVLPFCVCIESGAGRQPVCPHVVEDPRRFSQRRDLSIAQTPDGYLWLGTEFGLFRFDGVRNVSWQPPANQELPSNWIFSLLVARDGTLWIGTAKGLASWKEGKLTQYAELAGQYIFKLLEDREGSVWASGVAVPAGRLCAIRNGSVQCFGDDGCLGRGVFNLYEDSKGNLWAGVKTGLWRWKPGPPKFYPLAGEPDGIQCFGEDNDGTLLVGWNGGIHRFVEGKTEAYLTLRNSGAVPGPKDAS